MPFHRGREYRKFSEQLKNQLVRRLDGTYEKIDRVTGIANSNPIDLFIHTVEGNTFWCNRASDGSHYVEISEI